MRKSLQLASALMWAGLALPTAAHAGQRALLVGVGDYPQKELKLQGPAGDVERIAALLKARFGFADRDILKLLDRDATTEGVKKAFREQLIAGAGAVDLAVFYFTGHGGFVPDLDGDEKDGQDEALCTYNIDGMKPETWLIDDTLRELLAQMKARRVLVILDCCHSGTGTRGVRPAAVHPKFRAKFMPLGFLGSKDAAALRRSGKVVVTNGPANHLLMAACEAQQEAFEVIDAAGRPGSVFTSSLVAALSRPAPALTFRQVQAQVSGSITQVLREAGAPKRQTPAFEGAWLDTAAESFFAGTASAPPPGASSRVATEAARPELAASGDIRIELSARQNVLRKGDKLVLTARTSHDCHLRLYDYNAERQVVQIFPNRFQRTSEVRADTPLTIPGPKAPFAFEMDAPFGAGIIVAVASSLEFTDSESADFEKELFHSLGSVPLGELGRRGVNVKPAGQAHLQGKAFLIYRVDEAP